MRSFMRAERCATREKTEPTRAVFSSGDTFSKPKETLSIAAASSRGFAPCALAILQAFPMPELPEVETTVRGLVPVLEGRRLVRVETRRANLRRAFPADLRQRLTG